MKGTDNFQELWKRRKEIQIPVIGKIPVIDLPDLIKSKKTQRDKDWLMIKRLIESDIYRSSDNPSREKIKFWLNECKTPELLISFSSKYKDITLQLIKNRPLLKYAIEANIEKVKELLIKEEKKERELDKQYWDPLKAELETWRLKRNKK